MATVIYKGGKKITLLNPSEKGVKAAAELKLGVKLTNDGQIKRDEYGNAIPLTDSEKAWRGGVLSARRDSANCYNAQHGKKSKAKKRGKKQNKNSGNLPAIY